MKITIEASPADADLLDGLLDGLVMKGERIIEILDGEEEAMPGIENEDMLPVPISFRFVWEDNHRRECEVPRLVGIWMKAYGWQLGGHYKSIGEIKVNTEVLLPRPIATAILENDYTRFDLLPSGRR